MIVHTNLGRAPWPAGVAAAAADLAGGYLLLELDRATGRRGARARVAEDHLVALTGAEDALVTNNNAAAIALAVGLAGRGGVVVSRGELVEIGGGVRIPEIVRRAGAKLIEVGTTNRTRAADFEAPLAEGRARVVLRVHPSNFTMAGFTEAPDPGEVAAIAHRHGAIVVDDLGSGALLDTAAYGLAHEPMPGERLAAGADLVTFSGDKLVGGPQAGFIVGRADLVARLRRDPLARAMRPDKVTMAAVAATLGLYRAGRATTDIPVWRMIAAGAPELRRRAEALATRVGERAEAVACTSTVGGGSLPGETLPSWGVALRARSANRLLAALRDGSPIVVGRIVDGRVVLDLRTVEPARDEALAAAVGAGTRRRGMTVVVGTAGHIDHGKTTLLRALTGIDADRLPEERRRGMTIDVGYAHLALRRRHRARLRRRPRARPAGRQHARRRGRDRRGDARRRRRRRRRARRRASTSRCSTRSGSAHGIAVVTKIDAVEPARVAEVVDDVDRLLRRHVARRLAGPRRLVGLAAPGSPRSGPRSRPSGIASPRARREAAWPAASRRRPRLHGQGPRRRRDRHAPRRPARSRRDRCGVVPGDGTRRGSARSRSTARPSSPRRPAGPRSTSPAIEAPACIAASSSPTDPAVAATSRLLVRLAHAAAGPDAGPAPPRDGRGRRRRRPERARCHRPAGRRGRGDPAARRRDRRRAGRPVRPATVGRRRPDRRRRRARRRSRRAASRAAARRPTGSRRCSRPPSTGDGPAGARRRQARPPRAARVDGGHPALAADVDGRGRGRGHRARRSRGDAAPTVRAAAARAIRRVATGTRDEAAAAAAARRRRRSSGPAASSATATGFGARAPRRPARTRPRRRDGPARAGAGGPGAAAPPARPPAPRLPAGRRSATCERSGRIVVLEPDLAYAMPTYRDLAAPALAMADADAADPGRLPGRDRDEPQVRHGRSSRTSTGAGSCAGRPTATSRARGRRRDATGCDRVTVAAIVLAGGRSSRFGRDKLAEPVDGRPLLDHAIDAVRPARRRDHRRRRAGRGAGPPRRRAARARRERRSRGRSPVVATGLARDRRRHRARRRRRHAVDGAGRARAARATLDDPGVTARRARVGGRRARRSRWRSAGPTPLDGRVAARLRGAPAAGAAGSGFRPSRSPRPSGAATTRTALTLRDIDTPGGPRLTPDTRRPPPEEAEVCRAMREEGRGGGRRLSPGTG